MSGIMTQIQSDTLIELELDVSNNQLVSVEFPMIADISSEVTCTFKIVAKVNDMSGVTQTATPGPFFQDLNVGASVFIDLSGCGYDGQLPNPMTERIEKPISATFLLAENQWKADFNDLTFLHPSEHDLTEIDGLTIDLRSNALSSGLPAHIFNLTGTNWVDSFSPLAIDISDNPLIAGQVPSDFFTNGGATVPATVLGRIKFYASGCGFSGNFPAGLLDPSNIAEFDVDFSHNQFYGSLPVIYGTGLTKATVDLSFND